MEILGEGIFEPGDVRCCLQDYAYGPEGRYSTLWETPLKATPLELPCQDCRKRKHNQDDQNIRVD